MEFDHLRNEIIESNTISNQLYDELDVKRGLRNSDGSGVLAGLSQISSVVGVNQSNGQRAPVDGVLKYRGLPIENVVKKTNGLSRFEDLHYFYLIGRTPKKDKMHQIQQFSFSPQKFI